jgi:hypothetical protein
VEEAPAETGKGSAFGATKEKASGTAEEEKDAEVAHEDYTLAVTELQIGVKFERAAEVK